MLRKIIIIACCLLICFSAKTYSQSTYNVLIKDTIYDHQVHDAVELSSGNLIIIDVKNLEPPDFCARLTKINTDGTILIQKEVRYSVYPSGLTGILKQSDNEVVLCGVVMNNGLANLWICIIDSSLNMVKSSLFPIYGYKVLMCRIKSVSNGNMLCYGTLMDTSIYETPYAFIYKFSNSMDSLQLKIFNNHWSMGQDLVEKNDFHGYYFVVLGLNGVGEPGRILCLDHFFNITKNVEMPNVSNLNCIRFSDTGHVVVTGIYNYTWPMINKRDIGVLKFDTLLNLEKSKAFGKPDTEDLPGLQNNLDVTYKHKIFFGGTSNISGYEFQTQDSWYFLNNVDSSLILNWQKFYGGDGYYSLYGVLATRDGGCLMYGTFWDFHNTSNLIRDISVIKVNKDGLLLGTDGQPSALLKDVILYPNPGNEKIWAVTGRSDAWIEFLDLNGRKIFGRSLNTGHTQIETSELSHGIYIYRVFDKKGLIQTGKWIKE